MIYFTAHTFNCVCHSIRTMFRVLGVYNFGWRGSILRFRQKIIKVGSKSWPTLKVEFSCNQRGNNLQCMAKNSLPIF